MKFKVKNLDIKPRSFGGNKLQPGEEKEIKMTKKRSKQLHSKLRVKRINKKSKDKKSKSDKKRKSKKTKKSK